MQSEGGSRALGVAGFVARAAAVDRKEGPERRHEVLMDAAVERDGMDRAAAEAIYELASEEGLEPELALLLVATGVGVVELEALDTDPEDVGSQQAPPGWVAAADIPVSQARWERRLRLGFRRLRTLYEEVGSAGEAARRFASEPDVAEGVY